ncbi:unnamed protein product, partial [Mesorhabditis belari]|uniref:Uncharacterized protein n=1 Tax=Mesorhabditis belari TaxID=2138241 RepID=A0AAF3J2U1_9BILA
MDPRKPKQRAQCCETNVTLPRKERREESYRPCLIKLTKFMRREMMTAEEIQVHSKAEKIKEPHKSKQEKLATAEALFEPKPSKRTKPNEQMKPDANELELKTDVKGPSDSVHTARALCKLCKRIDRISSNDKGRLRDIIFAKLLRAISTNAHARSTPFLRSILTGNNQVRSQNMHAWMKNLALN